MLHQVSFYAKPLEDLLLPCQSRFQGQWTQTFLMFDPGEERKPEVHHGPADLCPPMIQRSLINHVHVHIEYLTFFMYIRKRELPVCIPRHWLGGGMSESCEACLDGYIWPKWRALDPRELCPVQPNEWGWVETELALALRSEVWFSLDDIWGGGEVSVSTEFCLEDGILTELLDWDLDGGSEGMYQEDGELELEWGRMEMHFSFLFFLSATSLKFVVLLCL